MANYNPDYRRMKAMVSYNLRRRVKKAATGDLSRVGLLLRSLANEYKSRVRDKSALQITNAGIATLMREAVTTAYDSNVLAVRSAPSYRSGDGNRYSGGALGTALASPTMAVGDADGISFIDTKLLHTSARHYWRLNFGAAPGDGRNAQPQPRAQVRFGSGRSLGSLRLDGRPSASFMVPEGGRQAGFFTKTGEFHIKRPPADDIAQIIRPPRQSKGIGARRFLDAGVVALATGFRPAYEAHFDKAEQQAVVNFKKRTL